MARWVTAGIGLLVFVAGVVFWLMPKNTRGAEIAGILSLAVAVAGLVVSAIAAWLAWVAIRNQTGHVDTAARELARLVAEQERPALNQLLGDQAAPQAADVAFAQPSDGLVTWRTDGGARRGSLREIAGYYRSLRRGRLVVLGDPGAGKTVLALQLVLDLLDGPSRVPVRLSLPAYDTSTPLETWIAQQIRRDFGLSERRSVELVRYGRVLPVLDGLDEMDADNEPPERAEAVVRALNHLPIPVVLTCRTQRYHQLPATVQDSTVVVLRPLTPGRVAEYLTVRFPDAEKRWQPILARLRRHHAPDPLVTALCSPLRLFLAVTAYRTNDPTPLLDLTTGDDVDQHLLDRLIPAAVAHSPGLSEHKTRHWLTTLAHHLDDKARHGYSGSDIYLNYLWLVAGDRLPRYLASLPLFVLTVLIMPGNPLRPGSVVAGIFLFMIAGGALFQAFFSARRDVDIERISVGQLRTLRGWIPVGRSLLSYLPPYVLIGVVVVLLLRWSIGKYHWEALLLMINMALIVSLAAGLRHIPSTAPRPGVLVRQGMQCDLSALLWAPIVIAIGTYAHSVDLGLWLGGIMIYIGLSLSPWPRYFVTVVILAGRGVLPFRTAKFLDWALDAGLLRMSGIAIQFRHRDFQQYLSRPSHPSPTATPAAHTPHPPDPTPTPPDPSAPR